MNKQINWIGVAGGIATLTLIAVSLFVPWWHFTVGTPAIAEASFSPVSLNFSILGNSLTIPLILALNLASLLSLASGGIILLIYSIIPTKSYSKRLLGFGYNKPLIAVIFFIVELLILSIMTKILVGFDVPLMGSTVMQLPYTIIQGANIGVFVSAGFSWPFYFAIIVAGLCVGARFYHRKVGPSITPSHQMPTLP